MNAIARMFRRFDTGLMSALDALHPRWPDGEQPLADAEELSEVFDPADAWDTPQMAECDPPMAAQKLAAVPDTRSAVDAFTQATKRVM